MAVSRDEVDTIMAERQADRPRWDATAFTTALLCADLCERGYHGEISISASRYARATGQPVEMIKRVIADAAKHWRYRVASIRGNAIKLEMDESWGR